VRPKVRRSLSTVIAVVIGCLSLPALGAAIDDPPYAQGPLDLKRLVATKHDAGAPIHLTVVTYEDWQATLLAVSGPNRIRFLFNPARSGREDFVGEVLFRDGRLWMRIETRSGHFLRRVRAYHPNGHTVRATVPRSRPNPDGNAWIAVEEEYTTATGPCVDTCRDRAPGRDRWLKLTPGQ
jgi:hypothetical protein